MYVERFEQRATFMRTWREAEVLRFKLKFNFILQASRAKPEL